MDCKILALVYFLDTFHCNTVTIVELGCVFRNSLSSGPSSDEEIIFLFKRFHGAFLFGKAMASTADLLSLGHRVLSWGCEWSSTSWWPRADRFLVICLWILSEDKNLLIKLGMFASDDTPKILVLSLDRKTEIPLPKRQAVQMGLMAVGCGVPRRSLL